MSRRNLGALAGAYDLVVVGAGVQGVAVGLEAAARGLRPLVVDRADFGSMTTAKTLRIIHGGLRYLQFLDYGRFRTSVEQRQWWLRRFPELVTPTPCLMPLYGVGLQRPAVLRAALLANDVLSWSRNRGLDPGRRIPSGRLVSKAELLQVFSACRTDGVQGAALWTDASMESSERLLMEMVRWIRAAGGEAVNYVSATAADVAGGAIRGLHLLDVLTGDEHRVEAPWVVNAAGPWCGSVAEALGTEPGGLPPRAVAFNVLLRLCLPAGLTVGVSSPSGGPVRFLRAFGEVTLAGTVHGSVADLCVPADGPEPRPSEKAIGEFLDELNQAVPGLGATRDSVVRTFAGYLPTRDTGGADPLHHPVVIDHGRAGGPRGLYSVSAVKFTTAPAVARDLMERLAGRTRAADWRRMERLRPTIRPVPLVPLRDADPAGVEAALSAASPGLQTIVEEESVVFGEDLVWRRLDWPLRDVDLDAAASAASRIRELALPRSPGEPSHPVSGA